MAVSKKVVTKKGMIIRFIFALILVVIGLLLNLLNMGKTEFFSYSSVGTYMIFCGILVALFALISNYFRKDKIIDERAEKVSLKAIKWVWYLIFVGGFAIMLIDGVSPLLLSIREFIAYSICAILLVYIIAYKIIERNM